MNCDFNKLVSSIVDSYSELPEFLPNRAIIIEIIDILRRLIFPGYFEKEITEIAHIDYHVGSLLSRFKANFSIRYAALLHDTTITGKCGEDAEQRSIKITNEFLSRIPKLRKISNRRGCDSDGDPPPATGTK